MSIRKYSKWHQLPTGWLSSTTLLTSPLSRESVFFSERFDVLDVVDDIDPRGDGAD